MNLQVQLSCFAASNRQFLLQALVIPKNISRIKDAGGSRTHLKLLCRLLPCRLAPAPRSKSVLARSRTWSTTIAKSRASITLQGHVEISSSRNRTLSSGFEDHRASSTLTSQRIHRFHAMHFITGSSGSSKGRRLDSHQHEPVYKTGAFLSRATSAVRSHRCSTSVRIRTPCISF